jgi:hypothetical protein
LICHSSIDDGTLIMDHSSEVALHYVVIFFQVDSWVALLR